MKVELTIFALFFLSLSLTNAQRPGNRMDKADAGLTIKGTVLDGETQQPLEYATISVFTKPELELVDGNITDASGSFVVTLKPGTYDIKVEFLGYTENTITDFVAEAGKPFMNIGTINLAAEVNALEEVVITEEKSSMQLGLDKKIFNVGKDLASRGGTAAELLDNVPSVQVDIEGNVSLRGSQNVRILIDGKPSGLTGMSGLRALQANMIEKVEVITNPSARYEAEGMSGIINIVLKKNLKKGFNGAFEATVGWPKRYGVGANLNYRAKQLNFFINYSITQREGPGVSSLYQELYRGDTTAITEQTSDRLRGGLSNNIRFGADYFFNAKNTLTAAMNVRIGDEDNFAETLYKDYINSLENSIGQTLRTDDEREDEQRSEYSLNYKRTYDRKGQEWSADIRYQDNSEIESSDLKNVFFNPDGSPSPEPDLLQQSRNNESDKRLIISSDFVLPFSKDNKFELGGRVSIRNIDNDFRVEELRSDVWEILPDFTNTFEYRENIYAAYVIYGNKINKFSYQIGVRPEYTDVVTRLIQSDSTNARDYLNIFPSGHIGYELADNNSIQLSYSRRVRRPRFWDLNPFFTFSDDRNQFGGNPNLDPEFTDAIELGHVKYWDKASLSSAIYYRHTTDIIQRVPMLNDLGGTTTRPENLSTENAFGFEFNTSFNPNKWFRFNADFNFYRFIVDGSNVDSEFAADNYSWFTRGTTRFKIWDKTDVQLRFNYRAPQETVQGSVLAFYSFDLAASHDVLKDKATITFSVRDVLNSRRRRYTLETDEFFRDGDFQWRARQATLSFNYRINQKKSRRGGNGRGYGGGEGGGEY